MCAQVGKPRACFSALALIVVILLAASAVNKVDSYFWLPALVFSVPVGIGCIMDQDLKLSREKLLRKQEEVEHLATLAERERISRDLHDLLGHTLSVITLKAELAGKLLDRDIAASRKEIADIEATARQTLSEVRSAVSGYRSAGLKHELQVARAALQAAQVELNAELDAGDLPAAAENVLSLAIREAVTNILRHAQASQCRIRLVRTDRQVRLQVSDNGENLPTATPLRRGNGLNGMEERIAAVGGSMQITIQRGLTLDLSLPLERNT
jgi:two-component system sensor histidine kinase DesK